MRLPRTIALSWGSYAGFYRIRGRICLGWLAITWLSFEIDELIRWAVEGAEYLDRYAPIPGQGIAGPPTPRKPSENPAQDGGV